VRAAVFYRNEVLAVVRDVTARRVAEEAMAKLKEPSRPKSRNSPVNSPSSEKRSRDRWLCSLKKRKSRRKL